MDFSHINRIEIEVAECNSKEDRLRKIFKSNPSIEKSLSKDKLNWCENMLVRYRNTKYLEERSALQIIKNERNNLIKQLYPNRTVQFFYKLMSLLVLEKSIVKRQKIDELKNNRSLARQLKQAGFTDSFNSVERYMRLGHGKFTMPVSYYLNEKERIDHSLRFKKDDMGYYKFEGFSSRLNDHSKSSESRQHYFSLDEGCNFNAAQAYNLLSGRAVLIEGTWKQFDLNDKVEDGNYRIKEFPEHYGYNIEKALSQLPLKISDQTEIGSLAASMKEGSRKEVTLLKDGTEEKIFIEPNPQFNTLNIYNQSLKKTSISAVQNSRKNETVKLQIKKDEVQTLKISRCRGKSRSI